MEISQIRLLVSDFGACFRFYRDVLGLTPQVDDERGPYGKLSLPEGTCAVALHDRADFDRTVGLRSEGAGDRALVVIKVSDCDQVVARVRALGASVVGEPREAWGRLRVAYLRDPEGNLIELQQWLVTRA